MTNWIAAIIFSFFSVSSAFSFTDNVFLETLDISVGHDHVCAITNVGIKCFGNSDSLTLKTPSLSKNPRSIKTGNRFSCLLFDDGIKCWGVIPNVSSSEMIISNKVFSSPKLLSVGYEHACAVSSTNEIKCWGNGEYGETIPPLNLKNITELSLGMNNSCVISNGSVVCWGKSIEGTIDVPVNLKNPRNLTSGWWHHCVQTDDGIKCWGYPYKNFVNVDDRSIKDFSSGGFTNCALVASGVKCWDELGKSNFVENSQGAYRLSVGSSEACAVTLNKGVICWSLSLSDNYNYKLLKSFVPSGGITNIDFISAGHASTCAVGDLGKFKCWGINGDHSLDIPASLAKPITQLSLGSHKVCVISDNVLSCWGDNNDDYNTPGNLGPVNLLSSGGNHICAGNQDKIKCWGDNVGGALNIPSGLNNISQISSGLTHVCAVSNNQVNCWGGEGLMKNINPPTKMLNPRSICAGGTFSCGISLTGSTQCWGDKIEYIGNDKTLKKTENKVLDIPKEIKSAEVTEVSCGISHACAIYNGKIKCWGDSSFLPKRLEAPSVKNPRNLTSGWNHTCVIGDLGLTCWGEPLNMAMPSYSLEK